MFFGGEDEIRTHARETPTNGLANHPLEPLEYLSVWRKDRDSNPRYGFPYAGFQDRCLKPTRPSFRAFSDKYYYNNGSAPCQQYLYVFYLIYKR